MLAKDLAQRGKEVLILERGSHAGQLDYSRAPSSIGSRLRSLGNRLAGSRFIERNIGVRYRVGVGGTTTIGSANAVRSLKNELQLFDVHIEDELEEVEQELEVGPFPQGLMGKGAQQLWQAADALGFRVEPMPKFVDFADCDGCGRCFPECPTGAKWTAIDLVKEAQRYGAALLENATATEVLTSNGSAVGVKARSQGEELYIGADAVILAAGAVGTPAILRNSGIDSAGQELFCDPFYVLYGPTQDGFYGREPRAIIVREFVRDRGFMLTNCIASRSSRLSEYLPRFHQPDPGKGMLGIMVKIKDDSEGRVHIDGSVRKTLTSGDLDRFASSIPIATEILVKAGVRHDRVKIRFHGGVHPGGSARIGEVVDHNLETQIENCHVCDASVLPVAPGLPPMLTILALSKRLAKGLVGSVRQPPT